MEELEVFCVIVVKVYEDLIDSCYVVVRGWVDGIIELNSMCDVLICFFELVMWYVDDELFWMGVL